MPFITFGQFHKDSYVFMSAEVDVRNAIIGSPTNAPAYDGVFNIGYREESFQIQASYENFKALDFYSFGFKTGYVFNHERNWNYTLMGGLSLIQRNVTWTKRLNCSASLNAQIEYHLSSWFVFARSEGRYRGDIKEVIPSGYLGIGIKL